MKHEYLIPELLSLFSSGLSAATDGTGGRNSFPLYLSHSNRRLLNTQISLSAGTGSRCISGYENSGCKSRRSAQYPVCFEHLVF